jgi:hypothetical protein
MSRAGSTLIEAIFALMLGTFVVLLCLQTTVQLNRAQRRLASRKEAVESLRVLRHVMRRELAHTGSIVRPESDSLSLRAFRGLALPCAEVVDTVDLVVAYRGDRLPDPSKDSVELSYADGSVLYADLTGSRVSSEPCGTAESSDRVLAWRIDQPLSAPSVLARVFERGSYHLAGSALRYRRGASGRQPLTPEVWSDSRSGWRVENDRIIVTVTPSDSAAGAGWSGFLSWVYPR